MRGMRISPRLAVNGAKVCDAYSANCPSCLGNLIRYIDIGSAKLYSRIETLGEIKRIATCIWWDRCVRTDAHFCLAWREPFMKQCPLLGPSDAAKWWELRTFRDE